MKRKPPRARGQAETPSSDPVGVVDLIEWNASLDCEKWPIDRLERLVGQNPPELRIRAGGEPRVVRSDEVFSQGELTDLPGIDYRRIEELRGVGLVAAQGARIHFYEGRRIIALFRGNLKALDRLERLIRGGK